MTVYDDKLGSAMFGGQAFPDKVGTATWDAFRSARAPAARAPDSLAASANDAAASSTPTPPASDSAVAGPFVPPMSRLSQPSDFDDRLPDEAAEKLRRLRELRDEAWALAHSIGTEVDDLRLDKTKAETRIRELIGGPLDLPEKHPSRKVEEEHVAVTAARSKLAKIVGEIARLEQRRVPHVRKAQALSRVVKICEHYTRTSADIRAATTCKPNKSDTIEALVARIAEEQEQRELARTAPWPSAIVKERITEEIQRLAVRGRPDLFAAIEHGEPVKWPRAHPEVSSRLRAADGRALQGSVSTSIENALAVVAWLHEAELLAKLHDEVDRRADDAHALDSKQRHEKIAAADAAILDAERTLAAVIWNTEAHHLWPERIAPQAVLSTRDD